MPANALPTSLQESVLTALVFDEKWGALVSAQIESDDFDEPYREVARRTQDYRKKYNKPPGHEHLDDLFGELLTGRGERTPLLRRVLVGLSAQAEGLNGEYVANQVSRFKREQAVKRALYRAGERYQQGGEDRLEEVEAILHEALRNKANELDAGVKLSDTNRSLNFLDITAEVMSLGIPELQRLGVGPAPRELLLYIAPKGSGKTWFAVHCGRMGVMQRHKVLHVTNETRADRVIGRYYQSLFAAATMPDLTDQTVFQFNSLGQLTDMKREKREPALSFDDPDVRRKLREKIKPWGARLGRILIKEFPTAALTIPQLVSYLDFLEQTHKFVPTLMIVDSPDLFRIPVNEFRLGTRRVYEELRGVASSRNLAIVATTQGNRASIGAKRVRSTNVAEDVSKIQTADNVLAYSSTEAEQRFGLGRLSVEHARNAKGNEQFMLAQNYALGQYVTQSRYMDMNYWTKLKEKAGTDPMAGEEFWSDEQ